MIRWEYHMEHFDFPVTVPVQEYMAVVLPRIQALGAEGWETIRVQPNLVWFKRPLPDTSTPYPAGH